MANRDKARGPKLFEVYTDHPHRVHFEQRPWIVVEDAFEMYDGVEVVPVPADEEGNPLEPGDKPWASIDDEQLWTTRGWSRELLLEIDYLSWGGFAKGRELEGVLISERVFVTLNELAPGGLVSLRHFAFGSGLHRSGDFAPGIQPCHYFEPVAFDGGRVDPVVRRTDSTVVFSQVMNRDDAFLDFGGSSQMIVTEGFRDAWLATDVSKSLREDPTEQDLWFVPSNGGFASELSCDWE